MAAISCVLQPLKQKGPAADGAQIPPLQFLAAEEAVFLPPTKSRARERVSPKLSEISQWADRVDGHPKRLLGSHGAFTTRRRSICSVLQTRFAFGLSRPGAWVIRPIRAHDRQGLPILRRALSVRVSHPCHDSRPADVMHNPCALTQNDGGSRPTFDRRTPYRLGQ